MDNALEVGEYTLHLRNVCLPMGLCVDDVKLSGRAMTLSRDPVAMRPSEEGRLRVHVTDHSLTRFLNEKSPAGLKKFHVTTHDGRLLIAAVKKVLVELKVHGVCALEIVGRKNLNVKLVSVDVAGADIRNLIQTQLDNLNPVIDVGDLPFKAEIDDAEVGAGGITLTGRIVP